MKNANDLHRIYETAQYLKNLYAERRTELLAKLSEDVVYQMPWITEDLFFASFKANVHSNINAIYQGNDEDIVAAIQCKLEDLERFIGSEYNVRENSSGSMHREVSTWKFIASMQMVKELKGLVG